jgi:predicted flavoprotein YhiN
VDVLPDISNTELYNILLKNKRLFYQQTTDNLFTGILQKRVAQAVLKCAGVTDFSKPVGKLSDNELKLITDTAKQMTFTVTENCGFDRAQAAKGGVAGDEIDAHTMKSKRCENLSVCGEAIDICGECGGYNLHFAFASGMIAGENL